MQVIPYKMPHVSIGLCVWRPSPHDHDQAVPAVITSVGARSVNLTVWPVDNRAGIPKDGVRYIGDPELFEIPGNEAGCWDYTDEQKKIASMAETLKSLV